MSSCVKQERRQFEKAFTFSVESEPLALPGPGGERRERGERAFSLVYLVVQFSSVQFSLAFSFFLSFFSFSFF